VTDYSKGDLVLATGGEQTSSCIILTDRYVVTSSFGESFYYSYCLESGLFGLIYEKEIVGLVCKAFAPDFEFHSELFETDYSYYSDLYENFAYFPSFWDFDPDDEEE
jgi:hypothetical protein